MIPYIYIYIYVTLKYAWYTNIPIGSIFKYFKDAMIYYIRSD